MIRPRNLRLRTCSPPCTMPSSRLAAVTITLATLAACGGGADEASGARRVALSANGEQFAPGGQYAAEQPTADEVKDRILYTQALEAARCMEEEIVADPREADVGSILGFGFAPFTGGTLSYIDGMGTAAFTELCRKFTKKWGPRFKPNRLLKEMAKSDARFYERFAPEKGPDAGAREAA